MRTSMSVAEEEEEEFYELMDRILSSSCSSTSASDDDADHQHHRRVPRLPPPVAASYDVWISEPSSVEECRHRLLQQMGLAADPGLSRARPAAVDGSNSGLADVGRSISCDGLRPRPDLSLIVAEPVFARSRSEGFVDPNPIKNLDNVREFVVKEFQEDQMWDKLREVGTGQQLTMKEFEMCTGRSPIVQELIRRQSMEESGDEDEPNYQ